MTATSPTERSRQHRARQSAKATAQAKRVEELEGACLWCADYADKLRHGTDDWFDLYEISVRCRQALEGSAKA